VGQYQGNADRGEILSIVGATPYVIRTAALVRSTPKAAWPSSLTVDWLVERPTKIPVFFGLSHPAVIESR
jgi:hypothetical protein